MRRVLSILLVAGVVLGYRWIRRPLEPWLPPTAAIARTPAAGELRVVTWNLRNFPHDHDQARLKEVFAELQADVYALQELARPSALSRLLPEHELQWSRHGGRHEQRLGIAYRPDRLELVGRPWELPELSLDGMVRPAFVAILRMRDRPETTFAVVVVHLKARPAGYELRRRQWRHLSTAMKTLRTRWTRVVLLGDFNVTGPAEGSASQEMHELERNLAPVGLKRVPAVGRCTAYWDGVRRDRWLEPSELDLGWIAGFSELELERATVGSHCARHHCRAFESSDNSPDPDFQTLSDHCPVIFDFT